MRSIRPTRVALGAYTFVFALLITTAAAAADPVVPISPAPPVVKTSTLAASGPGAIGLAAFQVALLPGSASSAVPLTPPAGGPSRPDRLVNLEGIGSDLFQARGTSQNEFWMTTDRGPNGEDAAGIRSFPAPWFTPTLLHVRASGHELTILDALPIVGGASCNTPVGGLPNLGGTVVSPANGAAYDDPPLAYDLTSSLAVPYTPSGLDVEGLVRLDDGSFWFVEEYSPSLGHLDANGCLAERIVPAGLPLTSGGALAPVTKTIPAIYQLRKKNRGFEALVSARPAGICSSACRARC